MNIRDLFSSPIGCVTLLTAVAACGDATDLPPATPVEIVVESGDEQTGPAGDTLPQPLVVTVLQENGEISLRPIYVELVDGGSAELGSARGSGEGVVLKAPGLGSASVEWILDDDVGTQSIRFFTLMLYGDTVDVLATAEATPPDP